LKGTAMRENGYSTSTSRKYDHFMAPYERLRAWAETHKLVLQIYRATKAWPNDEKYGLIAQARRAAFSIAANIAEGSAKRGPGEYRRFLDMAIGSSCELRYILHLARDLEILSISAFQRLESQRNTAGKLLWRLYQSIARRLAA
jgi:four helix bundle protein